MARLNEPPVSADSLEILRRKFLRQNRDIARINSTQSLKIRNLENECARLLSENLQLRSDVLRLKSELEGGQAHRIAEHALQIKEKMEAQLVEWGDMLANLGHEPVPKSRSPRALKKARIQRQSIGRSRVSDWRRRETMGSMQELEAAALQEGRLPPLWEEKTYPRETLNQDDILALCSEAEESTDSLDLGPPPVSRFVDEDPVKIDLLTLTKLIKPALSEFGDISPADTCQKPTLPPGPPAASTNAQDVEEYPEESRPARAEETLKSITESETQMATQAAKANLKRKAREDEKENDTVPNPSLLAGTRMKGRPEKVIGEKARPMERPMKELPKNKKDSREKLSHTMQRKPLGAKNSNESLGSPKKSAKISAEGKGAKPKPESKDDELFKSHPKFQKEPKIVERAPSPTTEPVTRVDIKPESLSAEPNLAVPDSPAPTPPREEMNDTPPPFDISSKGEATRPSRRARAAVSYAEPNLRDKMRRPNTKQLFDAVAGEGKNIRRTSQCQRDEPSSVPSSVAKSGARSEPSRKNASNQRTPLDPDGDMDVMASPLVQKTTRTSALEELPASVTTDRKRKDSIAVAQDPEGDVSAAKTSMKGAARRLEKLAAREAEVAELFDESDVYQFTDSSPNDTSKESTPEEKARTARGGRQSRSRRLSSISREDLQFEDASTSDRASGKHAGSRKRASMAAVRSTRSELENVRGDGSPADGDSFSSADGEEPTRARAVNTRRRSTML
ncbi:hypothetical protein F4802DRAFT_580626 [Xylaria palmicola]|nr:hypothetical protein F4802DRAFT_580626 [Xylaria palmicola]